jgi:lysophospholipase L1-like esterase
LISRPKRARLGDHIHPNAARYTVLADAIAADIGICAPLPA